MYQFQINFFLFLISSFKNTFTHSLFLSFLLSFSKLHCLLIYLKMKRSNDVIFLKFSYLHFRISLRLQLFSSLSSLRGRNVPVPFPHFFSTCVPTRPHSTFSGTLPHRLSAISYLMLKEIVFFSESSSYILNVENVEIQKGEKMNTKTTYDFIQQGKSLLISN